MKASCGFKKFLRNKNPGRIDQYQKQNNDNQLNWFSQVHPIACHKR